MAPKPDFGRLGERLQKKPVAAAEEVVEPVVTADATPEAPKGFRLDGTPRQRLPKGAGTSTDPRKAALVRLDKRTWRLLKDHALDDERPLQDILEEAVHDYLKRKGLGIDKGR